MAKNQYIMTANLWECINTFQNVAGDKKQHFHTHYNPTLSINHTFGDTSVHVLSSLKYLDQSINPKHQNQAREKIMSIKQIYALLA